MTKIQRCNSVAKWLTQKHNLAELLHVIGETFVQNCNILSYISA
jgi:hypothetical protein